MEIHYTEISKHAHTKPRRFVKETVDTQHGPVDHFMTRAISPYSTRSNIQLKLLRDRKTLDPLPCKQGSRAPPLRSKVDVPLLMILYIPGCMPQ
jgi:hypothetical protein